MYTKQTERTDEKGVEHSNNSKSAMHCNDGGQTYPRCFFETTKWQIKLLIDALFIEQQGRNLHRVLYISHVCERKHMEQMDDSC